MLFHIYFPQHLREIHVEYHSWGGILRANSHEFTSFLPNVHKTRFYVHVYMNIGANLTNHVNQKKLHSARFFSMENHAQTKIIKGKYYPFFDMSFFQSIFDYESKIDVITEETHTNGLVFPVLSFPEKYQVK